MIGIIALTIYFSQVQYIWTVSDKEYGPYEVEFANLKLCRGPKVRDAANYSASTLINDNGNYKITVNLTFLVDSIAEEVRVLLSKIKGNKKMPLLNYNLKKPCQHFALRAVIERLLGNDKCICKKGSVSSVLNLSDITQSYFGSKFFYGFFVMKAKAVAKTGNLICLSLTMNIFKK